MGYVDAQEPVAWGRLTTFPMIKKLSDPTHADNAPGRASPSQGQESAGRAGLPR